MQPVRVFLKFPNPLFGLWLLYIYGLSKAFSRGIEPRRVCGIAWILFFFPTGTRLRRRWLPPSPALFLITRPLRATSPYPSKRTAIAATSFLSAAQRLNCRRFSMGIPCPADDGRDRGREETRSRKTCLYSRLCGRASERASTPAPATCHEKSCNFISFVRAGENAWTRRFSFPSPLFPSLRCILASSSSSLRFFLSRFSHSSFPFSLFLSFSFGGCHSFAPYIPLFRGVYPGCWHA